MSVPSSSNVYNETRDFSQVPALIDSSVGAIVFAGARGPLEARAYSNINDWFVANGRSNPAVSFAPYCTEAFMKKAGLIWGKRAIGTGYSFGGLALQKISSAAMTTTAAATADPRPVDKGGQGIAWPTLAGASSAQDNLCFFYADGPGSYSGAELAVAIQSDNLTVPTGVVPVDASTVGSILVGVNTAGSMASGTYSYRVTAINSVGETLATTAASVTLTGTGLSVYVPWNPVVGAQGYKIYGRTSGNERLIGTAGGNETYFLDRGTVTPGALPPTTQAFTNEFNVLVYSDSISPVAPVETFKCSLLDANNGLGEQLEIEQRINGISKYIRVASNAAAFVTLPTIYSQAKKYFAAGSSGAAITTASLLAAWNDFLDPEKIDVSILINGGYSIPSVQMRMLEISESRGDSFAILDVPQGQQTAQLSLDYRNLNLNVNSNRGALYGPDVFITDTVTGKNFYCPPSGEVAGVFAYTDRTTYPWFQPAGLNRASLTVLGTRYKYEQTERDRLKDAQINYIRNMPSLGIAVMEGRTLQTKLSALSFISVRRLLDNIQKVCKKAQMFQLHEQNDAFTRTQVKAIVDQYCEFVKKARGLNKYLTIVDERNNPPFMTAQGILIVDVLIEPTLPVDRILMRYSITAQGVDMSSLIAAGVLG